MTTRRERYLEPPPTFTRRQYQTIKAMTAGATPFLAVEAVASVAIEHPEWDMNELRTWDEWEHQ
jgi:hypothetical protein